MLHSNFHHSFLECEADAREVVLRDNVSKDFEKVKEASGVLGCNFYQQASASV